MRRVILLVCLLGCGNDGSGLAQTPTGSGGSAGGAPGAGGSPATGGSGVAAAPGGSGGTNEPSAGGAPGAGGSSGAPGAGGNGTGGVPATDGSVESGGSMGGTGGAGGNLPEAGAELLYCPQVQGLSTMAGGCGYLGKDGNWISMWKMGLPCTNCVAMGQQFASCLISSPEGVGGEGPGPDLCVMNCRQECCYMRAGSVCDNDGQCCAPLKCTDNGPGMNKSCR